LWRSLRRRGKRYNRRAGKNAGRGLIPNRIDISDYTHLGTRETFTLAEMLARGYTTEELKTVPLGVLRSEGRRRWRPK
jgi:hypothetical protein